ncbi:glycosyltransferase family 2 protein [Sphingobacterium corticis]|uniref:Glycosyltransferase family 2 protein n=1 Tax=Sphingobacterium corticis TaxID=1812823 RepID=A0ABW5NGJ0_9SPHI
MANLAVIIPAYKSDYLESALTSFSKQSNKNFVLYIGDDASPYDLTPIINKFKSKLEIVYQRFEENFGSKSLVKQWERCIEMSSENWIWLFSDDDVVKSDAVDNFFSIVNSNSEFYKLRTEVINVDGNLHDQFTNARGKNDVGSTIPSEDFIKRRLQSDGFRSFAVEYIFSRKLYNENKFVEFPLAWASDDATWFLYSLKNGGKITVIDSVVYWRYSGSNLSSESKQHDIVRQKILASLSYVIWVKDIASNLNLCISDNLLAKWLTLQLASIQYKLSFGDFTDMLYRKTKLSISTYKRLKLFIIIKLYHLKHKIYS